MYPNISKGIRIIFIFEFFSFFTAFLGSLGVGIYNIVYKLIMFWVIIKLWGEEKDYRKVIPFCIADGILSLCLFGGGILSVLVQCAKDITDAAIVWFICVATEKRLNDCGETEFAASAVLMRSVYVICNTILCLSVISSHMSEWGLFTGLLTILAMVASVTSWVWYLRFLYKSKRLLRQKRE